jgi:hypothetical protein
MTYLKSPGTFPNGPDGRVWGLEGWYVPEEWRLNAGEAELLVNKGDVYKEAVNTAESEVVNKRREWMREYMRKRREKQE